MIQILLIDDLAMVRESLALALAAATDMELQCCSSMEAGMELIRRCPGAFDIVLLKLSSGGPKADALLSLANRGGLANRVLILTPGLSELEQRRLASLGVAGIFPKQRPLVDLIGAIRELAGGQTLFLKRTRFDPQPALREAHGGTLSPQERRAADLVLEGLANKEIGARMGVSESCIKALLQRAFLKLGVHSRGQLIRVLMERSRATAGFDGAIELTPSANRTAVREAARRDL